MPNPRVFISYDFDNNNLSKNRFVGQSKNSKVPFTISDWSHKESVSESKWREVVEERIKRVDLVIVLIGQYMRSATGVHSEVRMARRLSKPILGVYVANANSSTIIPDVLKGFKKISWTWEGIANEIDRLT